MTLPVSIVDDDEGVRSSLESLMRSAGLAARSYSGAGDFLSAPDYQSTGCLVTDLHMDPVDGLMLQQSLLSSGSRFPIVFVTGRPTEAARLHALKTGAAAFLTKPIDPDALIELVGRLIAARSGAEAV